jgi:DNA polymerase-3 subunit gamma/tau
MAYQVLARKYRPQFFADVAGQEHVTRTLLNALAQGRIAHGYIFSGHRGIGKTTVARILAMALNCRSAIGSTERPTPEPCATCVACTEIRAGNAVDVIEIDAATNRGIDEIRELREAARYSPARDRYKIYILDEAHQITDAAFNALLKTLEEPPAHVVFMMATTQPEDIPQTIRSRCQHFSFHAVRFDVIRQQLEQIAQKEGIAADAESFSLLAEAGDGSMRDALSILDQAIASAALTDGKVSLESGQVRALMGSVSNAVFEQMLTAVQEQNAAALLEQAAVLLDAGNAPQQIARQMVRFLRNCLMARIAGESSDLLQISEEEKARAQRVAAMFSEEDLTRFLNSMLRTFDDLSYRQEQRFHLELGLLKLVYTQRLLPLDEILRRLGSGATGAAAPRGSSTASLPAMAVPKQFVAPAVRTAPANASASAVPGSAATAPPKAAAVEEMVSAPVAQSVNESPTTEIPRAEQVRGLVCTALAEGGHATLATLLEEGSWRWDGRNLCVEAAAGKVMLEMAYTAEAQRIARERFRSLVPAGCNLQVTHEARSAASAGMPGASTQQAKAAPQRAAVASTQTVDHPLVQNAQKLFNAEIRSVVNLRDRS